MSPLHELLLVAAGFAGGLIGSVAGLASLVSYPALLAVGLSPIAANVSNTVALVFNGVGSVSASRAELRGQRASARALAPIAVAGGITGAVLLRLTPAGDFARIVPWLIALASIAILARRAPSVISAEGPRPPRWTLLGGAFLITVYGGYFGAAAGVLMLALLLFETAEPLARSNALKNLLMSLANLVAAIAFILFEPVSFAAVVPLALGFLGGGRVGPSVVRRAPAGPLRVLIAAAGIGLAVHLALDAYR